MSETFDERGAEFAALEATLDGAAGMAGAFEERLKSINETFSHTGKSAQKLTTTLTGSVTSAINGVALDGMKMSDALRGVANSMVEAAWKAAVKPVAGHVAGMLANGASNLFANGGAFSQGRVMPFANGGIVSGPTSFPMRGGTGLMGEAGPEAIMPLSRGADGKLGVRAQGSSPVTVVMNVTTPDARSFERSQSQIAARMSQALSRGARNH